MRTYFVISSTAYTNKEVSFFRPFPPKRGKEKAMLMEERKVCILEVKAEEQGLVFHYGSHGEVEICCCHNEGFSETSLGHGAYRQSDRS